MNWLGKLEADRIATNDNMEALLVRSVCPDCGAVVKADMARGLPEFFNVLVALLGFSCWQRELVTTETHMNTFDKRVLGTLSFRCDACPKTHFLSYRTVDFYARYPSLRGELRWHMRNVTAPHATWHFEWPYLTSEEWDQLKEWGHSWVA